jgi:hypothetical protein
MELSSQPNKIAINPKSANALTIEMSMTFIAFI